MDYWFWFCRGFVLVFGGFIALTIIIIFMDLFGDSFKNAYEGLCDSLSDDEEEFCVVEPSVEEKLGKVKIHKDNYSAMKALKVRFDIEEKNINSIIEYIFPEPQMTNNKFRSDVLRVHNAFYSQYHDMDAFYRSYPVEDDMSIDIVNNGYINLDKLYNSLLDLSKELAKLSVHDVDTSEVVNDMDISKGSVEGYDFN